MSFPLANNSVARTLNTDLDMSPRAAPPLPPVESPAYPPDLAKRDHAPIHEPLTSHYVFKRLKRDLPLPGKTAMSMMISCLFMLMFLAGWNDASQGPLLPSLQAYYNVDYLIISCIWVANFVGFMTSGLTNVYITDRLGFGLAAPLGAGMQALGYIFMCWGGPFPLFVCAYAINGFGLGLQDAQVNSLTTCLPNPTTKMFLLHSFYGLGATVAPLIATEFVKKVENKVYLYYLVSLGLALETIVMLGLVFKGRTQEQVVGRRVIAADAGVGLVDAKADVPVGSDANRVDTTAPEVGLQPHQDRPEEPGAPPEGSGGKLKRILANRSVQFMAFYMLLYVGIEVTIGGWATTFIIEERGGNSSAGYITTGYFGGLTVGRIILIPVTNWLGKHNSIHIYTLLALILEITIYFVRSIPANATCFALIGVLLGPMYPVVMMVVIDIIPAELQTGAIGWIGSLGSAGSAMMPFITGAIANRYGVWILQPLLIAFMGMSIVLWALVPRPKGIRA